MKDNYIVIQGWMVSELNLSGNDLLTYALIYGFSQDGESEFTGSINYLCKWLNCSRPTAIKSLKFLTEKNLIIKNVNTINGVSFNRYKISLWVVKNLNMGSKETLLGGSKETLPNNTIINNTNNNIENNIYSFDEFWNTYDKKLDRKTCEQKFNRLSNEQKVKIKLVLPNYLKSVKDKQYLKHPKTWLYNECWNDEIKNETISQNKQGVIIETEEQMLKRRFAKS
jgi:hypothetical protein